MSLTRAQRRAILYKLGLQLGFARTATTISGQTVTDSNVFTDTGAGEGDYTGCYIYIPLEVAANQIRKATVVSGSGLLQGGDAYAAVASLAYEVVGMHPDELNECLRRSLRRVYFETYAPLFPWVDGDFAAAAANVNPPYDWTALASGTTPTKDATPVYNQAGYQSLVLTGAGYVKTSSLYVQPGDTLVHGASSLVTATSATATYSLLDVSHGTVLISSPHSSLAFQHFLHSVTIPAGCFEVKAQLQVAGTGTPVAVWDYTFGHLMGRETGQVQLPSWLNEKWRLLDFGPAEYGRSTGSNLYNGSSRRWDAFRAEIDYDLMPLTEEAAKYTLQINRPEGLSFYDYWVHGLRPYSDIAADTEAGTTNAPEDLVTAGDLFEVAQALYVKTEDPKWMSLMQRAQLDLDAQRGSRRQSAPRRQRQIYVIGGRGGLNAGGRW